MGKCSASSTNQQIMKPFTHRWDGHDVPWQAMPSHLLHHNARGQTENIKEPKDDNWHLKCFVKSMQDMHKTDWGVNCYGKMICQTQRDVNVMANFHKTAQCPGSLIRMTQENFPRSTLVPHVRLTSFDLESLQNGCPCNALPFHPNGMHESSCQCHC